MAVTTHSPLPLPAPPAGKTAKSASKRRGRRWLPITGALALTVAAAGGFAAYHWGGAAPTSYRTAAVTSGDLKETVSATGTLSADTTVAVGTQVSGVVTELAVDYNDTVKAGQVLARIDPTLLQADVASAQATLTQRQAAETLAKAELTRTTYLASHDAASPSEVETAKEAQASALAQVRSARVALDRAQRNLGYATITSPIDGVVIDRAVNVGQTVNAGMSAPTLYTLAGDLKQMQVLATVDEADIGKVAAGQPVEVGVAAWPNATFTGSVRQVRMQSTTTDNVVTYTVVVDVSNESGKLLPGMTANVSFVVAEVKGADIVPAAALRFRPTTTTTTTASGHSGSWTGSHTGGARARDPNRGVIWTLGADGTPQRIVVTTGISDGTRTVISGPDVKPGLQVITGEQTGTTAAPATASSSPFQSNNDSHRGFGRRGGF